jgi:chromate transporter
MIILQLFYSFFRIGLFTFGGGYAMVPLIQREMISHHWLTIQQFSDIIAISQITPGPLAINTATYVGYRVAGIAGSAAATIGVVLPTLLLILTLSQFLVRVWDRPVTRMAFHGLRPTVVALLASATFFFARESLLNPPPAGQGSLSVQNLVSRISPWSVLLFAGTLFLQTRLKMHPILVIILCGVLSMIILPIL